MVIRCTGGHTHRCTHVHVVVQHRNIALINGRSTINAFFFWDDGCVRFRVKISLWLDFSDI